MFIFVFITKGSKTSQVKTSASTLQPKEGSQPRSAGSTTNLSVLFLARDGVHMY